MRYEHVIIGAGIAGASAAQEIRRLRPDASIALIGEEKHPVYSRVLLPHVADHRAQRDRATLRTAADFAARGIDYLSGIGVTRVDVANRTVALSDGRTLEYGSLLVATGATPRRFAGPGGEHCFTFRTLEDLDAFERATPAERVLVYGGSFNAIDLACSFARRDVPVLAAMRGQGYLQRVVDADGAAMIAASLSRYGVTQRPRSELVAVEKLGERSFDAHFADGTRERVGAVAVGIGVTPNVSLLSGAAAIGKGIRADAQLRALDAAGRPLPGVYVAGDVAEYFDGHAGRHRIAGNWQNAMFQGKTAGVNMAGEQTPFTMVTSYSIPCFTLPVSVIGAVDGAADRRVVRRTAGGASLQFVLAGPDAGEAAGRVVGASCIGPFAERTDINALIAGDKPLTEREAAALADPSVPLSALRS